MIICVKSKATRGGPAVWSSRFTARLRQRGFQVVHRLWPNTTAAFINIDPSGLRLAQWRRLPHAYRIAGCYLLAWAEALGLDMRPEFRRINERIVGGLQRANMVIYQSSWAKAQVDATLYYRSENYRIIYNGVDLERFFPAARPHNPVPVIGTTGEFRHRFRLETFFRLSEALRHDHRLLIVGNLADTASREVFAHYARRPGIKDRLTYRPRTAAEELPRYYQMMDCYIHPVSGDWCPNVVAEALGCGVPVVCPAFGGTAELVGDGGIAVQHAPWRYDSELFEKMADAVNHILEGQTAYAIAARRQAESHLDHNNMTDRYLAAVNCSPRAFP